MYSYIRSKTADRQSIGPLKGEGGKVVSSDTEMANVLNKFFAFVTIENPVIIPDAGEYGRSDLLADEIPEESKMQSGNYRPVSLTCIIFKVDH